MWVLFSGGSQISHKYSFDRTIILSYIESNFISTFSGTNSRPIFRPYCDTLGKAY